MKSFESLLKKRVISGACFEKDKYFLEKTFNETVKEVFGFLGCKYLKLGSIKNDLIMIRSYKSIWSTELILNKGAFIKIFNNKVGKDIISKIRILNK